MPRCRYYCSTQVVVGDRVYWNDQGIAYGQTDLRDVRVFDLSTGAETRGSARTLEADVRGSGRGVVLGRSPASGTAVLSLDFVAEQDHLAPADGGSAFDLATGRALELRLPDGVVDGAGFDLVQWLDDDRFVLRGGALDGYVDNLYVCSMADQACRQAAPTVRAESVRRIVNDRIVNM